jgi:hypothetical protein
MPVRRVLPLVLLLAIASPAVSAESGPSVDELEVTVLDQAVEVSGRSTFEGSGAPVAQDPAGDAAVADIGTDLVGASIAPSGEEDLRFRIALADPIDELVGLPEVIHYNWSIGVSMGGETAAYGLQAIRTSAVSDVRDGRIPVAEPVFRLLACSSNAPGTRSCSPKQRVDGAFDESGLELLVPKEAIEAKDGSLIEPGPFPINATAGVSGVAWYENGNGGDTMPVEASYAVGGVQVGIIRPGQPLSAANLVHTELKPDGTFSETLPLPPTHGSYLAVARACEAISCTVRSVPFEVLTDAPPEEPFDPVLVEQRVFFHCSGPNRLENADGLTNGPATWDSNAPQKSLAEAGCAALDPPARNNTTQESPLDAVFKGTAEGNLDAMTIRAYGRLVDGRGDQETFTILARLTIDGTVVLPPSVESTLVVTPHAGPDGLSLVEFTITNLQLLKREDHGRTHEVTFSLDPWSIDQDAVWIWDAVETPSGITFNPDVPAGPILIAPKR